jgi:hypothetical protein
VRSAFRWKTIFLFAVLSCAVSGVPALAQFESGVDATVVDSSGAVVPGAQLTLTNQATHIAQHATTNGQGYVRILQLTAGTYTAEVQSPGFKAWQLKDIVVEGSDVRTLYPALQPGAATEQVTVTAETQQIETTKGNIGRTLEGATLQESPMMGQNIYAGVATLAPGVTGLGDASGNISAAGSVGVSSFTAESGYQINAAGQRQEANEYQVDGTVVDSNSRDGVVNISPEPETVQEMKVTASVFSAEKGRQSGALIELFTKQGANNFHGMLSEFHTDNALTARTHFETTVPKTVRNDFGGTLGGPIYRNKTFFFGSLFWEKSVQGTTMVRNVETTAWRQYVQQKYPNNIGTIFLTKAPPAAEPTTGFETVAQVEQYYGSIAPVSDFSDFTGNVLGTASVPASPIANGFQGHLRLDHNMHGGNDKVFFSLYRNTTLGTSSDARQIYSYTNPNSTLYAKADYVHTFSPSLVNEVGVSYVRNFGSQKDSIPSLPNVYYIGGFSDDFSQWGPSNWTQNNFIYQDDLNWTHGRHSVHVGINVDRQQDLDNFENGIVRPYFYFLSPLDFAEDLPFYQGGPVVDISTKAVALNLYQRIMMLYAAPFVQDDWKVNSRLTLNLGLRLDYFGHLVTAQNGQQNIDFFTPGSGSDFNTQIANGSMSTRGNNGEGTLSAQYRVSPRIGFAWDVFGKGSTSIHGGYGIYSDKIGEYAYINDMRDNPPEDADPIIDVYSGSTRANFSYATSATGAEGFPVPPGITYQLDSHGGLVGTRTGVGGVDPNLKAPLVHSWALGVQQAVKGGWVLEADYLGTASRDLYLQTDVNRVAGDGIVHDDTFYYLNQSFASVEYGRNTNIGNTNVGALGVSHSFSHGFTTHATFTLAKSLDYLSSNDNGVGGGESVFDAANPQGQYGRSDYDSRKRLSVDAVWNVPGYKANHLTSSITNGWVVAPIIILQSGMPFTVYTSAQFNYSEYQAYENGTSTTYSGGDYNADGYDYDIPNVPSFGRTIHTHRSSYAEAGLGPGLFQSSQFPVPTFGTEGNLGRNTYDGPGYAQVNASFERKFPLHFLGDAGLFELRGEFLNLLNRVNYQNPISDMSNGDFGHSESQYMARQIQLQGHIRF